MSEVKISAEPRTEFGKGGARRTRRAGKVPAVLYGHGEEPKHIALPAREFAAAIRHGGINQVFAIDARRTAPRRWPCPRRSSVTRSRTRFEHVDLIIVKRGEKVTVEVPVHAGRRGGQGHAGHARARHAVHHAPRRCTCRSASRRRSRAWRPARSVTAGRRHAAGGRRAGRRPGAGRRRWSRRADRRAARGRGRRGRAEARGRRGRGRSRPSRPSRLPPSRLRRQLREAWTTFGSGTPGNASEIASTWEVDDAAVAGGRAGQPRPGVRAATGTTSGFMVADLLAAPDRARSSAGTGGRSPRWPRAGSAWAWTRRSWCWSSR